MPRGCFAAGGMQARVSSAGVEREGSLPARYRPRVSVGTRRDLDSWARVVVVVAHLRSRMGLGPEHQHLEFVVGSHVTLSEGQTSDDLALASDFPDIRDLLTRYSSLTRKQRRKKRRPKRSCGNLSKVT